MGVVVAAAVKNEFINEFVRLYLQHKYIPQEQGVEIVLNHEA